MSGALGCLAFVTAGRFVEVAYMAAALLFILGIKRLAGVKTARGGNQLAALGMALAVGATLYLLWGSLALWVILGGLAVGTLAGALLARRVPMTAMPELVALFNGLGGAASMCVALAEVVRYLSDPGRGAPLASGRADFALAIALSILIGGVTLSGSLVAYAKLAGRVDGARLWGLGGRALNLALGLGALLLIWLSGFASTGAMVAVWSGLLAAVSLLLGIGLVIPIGGADMPVVISLLNSYSGMAASATGFVLQNNLLITAGSLVGASGLILTRIMCKAMNRSLLNVLAGGFGEGAGGPKEHGEYKQVKATTAEEVAPLLEAASRLIIVPGYGLAVAQAQHKVREMAELLAKRGCQVSYAIHPVAGRMPGHMNVLLAEADVPYEQLFDLDQINGEFKNADLVLVIGANDVCNPAAIEDPASPIAGMPVLKVWEAQTVVNVKRSLSPGYAGIKNPLFERDNSLMLFADAKQALEDIVTELKQL